MVKIFPRYVINERNNRSVVGLIGMHKEAMVSFIRTEDTESPPMTERLPGSKTNGCPKMILLPACMISHMYRLLANLRYHEEPRITTFSKSCMIDCRCDAAKKCYAKWAIHVKIQNVTQNILTRKSYGTIMNDLKNAF